MQMLGDRLAGLQQQVSPNSFISAQPVGTVIPIVPDTWNKLSRETQLRLLSELGILAAEPTIREFKP